MKKSLRGKNDLEGFTSLNQILKKFILVVVAVGVVDLEVKVGDRRRQIRNKRC